MTKSREANQIAVHAARRLSRIIKLCIEEQDKLGFKSKTLEKMKKDAVRQKKLVITFILTG